MIERIAMVLLLIIVLIFYILSLPSLNNNIQTGNNTALANETSSVKAIYNNMPLILLIIPFIIFAFIVIILAGMMKWW